MYDIAIIGGGPAGLAAGLYAARGGAKAALFEELFAGGQAAITERIENYPGFPEGVEGPDLGMRMQEQASRFGLEFQYDTVQALELAGPVKKIITAQGMLEAKTVILCMGAKPRKLELPREEELTGLGVSYCATCDGAFFKDKAVAVVGGGDTALADAIYLARFAKKVYLVHRRDQLRGSKTLQDAVFAEANVELVWNSVPQALLGEQKLSGLRVKDVVAGTERDLDVEGLFVAIGIQPRNQLVADQLQLNSAGHIQVDAFMRTSLPGVYAAGDIRNTPLRQVVTAVADGAVAATAAMEDIATL